MHELDDYEALAQRSVGMQMVRNLPPDLRRPRVEARCWLTPKLIMRISESTAPALAWRHKNLCESPQKGRESTAVAGELGQSEEGGGTVPQAIPEQPVRRRASV